MYIYNPKTREYESVFKSIDSPVVKVEKIEHDILEDFSYTTPPEISDIRVAALAKQQCMTLDNAKALLRNLGRVIFINHSTGEVDVTVGEEAIKYLSPHKIKDE